MSDDGDIQGISLELKEDEVTTDNVIPFPLNRSAASPVNSQIPDRCECGSAWFTGALMFYGERLLAYSTADSKCAVCGKAKP